MEIKWNHLSKAFNKVFLINRPNKTVGKKKVPITEIYVIILAYPANFVSPTSTNL